MSTQNTLYIATNLDDSFENINYVSETVDESNIFSDYLPRIPFDTIENLYLNDPTEVSYENYMLGQMEEKKLLSNLRNPFKINSVEPYCEIKQLKDENLNCDAESNCFNEFEAIMHKKMEEKTLLDCLRNQIEVEPYHSQFNHPHVSSPVYRHDQVQDSDLKESELSYCRQPAELFPGQSYHFSDFNKQSAKKKKKEHDFRNSCFAFKENFSIRTRNQRRNHKIKKGTLFKPQTILTLLDKFIKEVAWQRRHLERLGK